MVKKNIPVLIALCVILCASCKKSNSLNQWTFKGVTYHTVTGQVVGNSLIAAADSGVNAGATVYSRVVFSFLTIPSSNGTYGIVNHTGIPHAGQVVISLQSNDSSATTYFSTGNDRINAAVTVSNYWVAVSVPPVWLRSSTNPSDSAQLTANVSQNE